jgi:predicted nucleic acid-binding Zn ribbon protein
MKRIASLNEVAAKVLGRADRQNKRGGAAAVNAWGLVVGDEIARRTRGFALRDDGELVVFVENGAWATQLTAMSQELLERLNDHLGENRVKTLRFTVSRKARSDEVTVGTLTDEVLTVQGPAPLALDDTERAQADQVASVVKNEALRQAALRAMIKDLEQKKGLRGKRPNAGH